MNIGFKLQFSERDKEILVDGGFETWAAGQLVYWTRVVAGSSTVTQETTSLRPGTTGSSAVRFTYDATPNVARIHQTRTFIPEAWYYLKFWYKCNTFSQTKEWSIRLRDAAANVYLQDDLSWDAASNDIMIPSCDKWTYFELKILMHPDYTSYFLGLGNGNQITSDYIIIDDFEIKLDTTFLALDTATIGGVQYVSDILNSPLYVEQALARRGRLENQALQLQLDDHDITIEGDTYKRYRKILSENKINGRSAISYDGDGNKLGTFKIIDYGLGENMVSIELSDAFLELTGETVPGIITEERFPGAPSTSIGKYINHFSGSFMVNTSADAGKKNYLVAHRIYDNGPTTPAKYLIGKSVSDIVVFSGTQDFQYVTDDDDTIILASKCTLVTPTATDEYHYIEIIAAEPNHDFVKVHFKYPATSADSVVNEIGELFFSAWPFDTTDIAGLLASRNYNIYGGGYQDRRDPHFLIDSETKYVDILKQICESFNLSYTINPEGYIIFKYFDVYIYEIITSTIQDEAAALFDLISNTSPYDSIINRISMEWGYDGTGGNANLMIFQNRESQVASGTIKEESMEANLLPSNYSTSKRFAHFTARQMMIEDFSGREKYAFQILNIYDMVDDTNTMNNLLAVGNILKFKHPQFYNTTDYHFMLIDKVTREYPSASAVVEFTDISSVAAVDNNAVCKLQSNSDNGSLVMLDHAANGWHVIDNYQGEVEHSTDYPLFAKTSLKNNNSNPDLRIAAFSESNDMQIFSNLGDGGYYSSTLAVWVKFDAGGSQEAILSQYTDSNNYWVLYKATTNLVRLTLVIGGATILNLLSTSTVANGKWNHIVFHRTDSIAGLYINGQQQAYSTASLDYPFFEVWHGYNDGNGGNYMSGNIQDIYIAMNDEAFPEDRKYGWFELNPNSGNTDTYTVPWGLMSVFWQEYYIDF